MNNNNSPTKWIKRCLLLFMSIMLITNSCKKENGPSPDTLDQSNTQQLQQWYKANISANQTNPFGKMVPNWNAIYVNEQNTQLIYEISLSNPEKVFQASGAINKDQTDQAIAKNSIRLLIFKDKQDGQIKYGSYMSVLNEGTGGDLSFIHYRQIDNLSGRILYYDTQGKFANGWMYNNGKITHIMSGINEIEYRAMVAEGTVTSVSISPTGNPKSSNGKVISLKQAVYCTTTAIPTYGLACIAAGGSGTITCEQYVIRYDYFTTCTDPGTGGDGGSGGYTPPTPGGSGGGGGSGANNPQLIPADPIMPGQGHPAINPKEYTKCFDNIPNDGATFKVTVQVEEPMPGTTASYDYVNPANGRGVGHTAITMTKTGANGTSVSQTIGFYPSKSLLGTFLSPSKLVDNGLIENLNQPMNPTISMDFNNIDATHFAQILNQVSNPPATYEIFGMNCTAFVVKACSAGGLSLPNPVAEIGYVQDAMTMHSAATPGGLGYSMRQAKAAGNNNVNTTPSTPKSDGPCK